MKKWANNEIIIKITIKGVHNEPTKKSTNSTTDQCKH